MVKMCEKVAYIVIHFQVFSLNMMNLTGLLAIKDCELKSHLATLNPCPGNNQELFPTVYFVVFLSWD